MEIKVLDDTTLSKYRQRRIENLNMKNTQNDYIKYRFGRAGKHLRMQNPWQTLRAGTHQ